MNLNKITKGYLMVMAASICFGTSCVPGKILLGYQISPMIITWWRLFLGFTVLLLYVSIKDPKLLKIDKKGMIYTALIGLISYALLNFLNLNALEKTSVATQVVLLYTAPIFVIIMARIFFKELLTPFKIAALVLCIGGCFLTVTGGYVAALKFNLLGVLMGIGAGLCYALLTIMSKAILHKYNQWTIVLYAMGFGFLFLLPFSNPLEVFHYGLNPKIGLSFFWLGSFSTALSYGLYITGLSSGIESSKAGMISTLEVVVAVTLSYLFFNEMVLGWKLFGVLMVIASVIIIQVDTSNPSEIKNNGLNDGQLIKELK